MIVGDFVCECRFFFCVKSGDYGNRKIRKWRFLLYLEWKENWCKSRLLPTCRMIVCAVCVSKCECRRLFPVNTSIVIVTVFRINTELKKKQCNAVSSVLHRTRIDKGGMIKFRINCQCQSELICIVIFHFFIWKAAMNVPPLWKLFKRYLIRIG